jgi:isoleucyl-tRNA synthetase
MARKYPEYKHLNLPEINKQILEFWKENNTFQKSISSRQGKPTFTFYEGPPSANGLPGIHHVMARAIKDIFCRFKTLEGYQVKRKAGWDTHGLPVELGVEKELGITKEDIGKTISVEDYNAACKKAVMRYTDVWNDLTEKMGYWVDMDDPYVTYTPKYMETVWWLLKQLWDKDLMYKGYTIQPYSPKAGTGLSSHELNMPGCYRNVKDTSAIAQFSVIRNGRFEKTFGEAVHEKDRVYFIAWTTTPWTLPSNTALTVGKKIDYVMVESFNQYTHLPQKVILAKNLVNKYFKAEAENEPLENYQENGKSIPWRVVWQGKGQDLLELRYEQLLPYVQPYQNPENAFRVIAGDFVTTEDGTGIVHTAPTFGADDAKVAKEAQPPVPPMLVLDQAKNPVPLVDLQGRFRPEMGELAGKYVKNEYYADGEAPEKSIDVEIAILLKEQNKAFKVEKYEHSYPHCWRTDKPVLYYPLDSWFVNVTNHKKRLVDLNKTINWKPKSTGEGRFGNWLENANDWNLSRSRYWGVPLPIWSTEDGSERRIFGSVEELKQACDEAVEAGLMDSHPFQDFKTGDLSEENYNTVDLHRHIVDKVVLKSSKGEAMRRENDLIDVWFDSGSMPYAQWHYPFEPLPEGENSPLAPKGGSAAGDKPEPKVPLGDLGASTQSEAPATAENSPLAPKGGSAADDKPEPKVPLGDLGASTQSEAAPRWQTAKPEIYETLKKRAKELRENETEAEKLLWNMLQNKKVGGYKFRRQHIIDQYIVDFACLSRQLVIEVDGGYHIPKDQRGADQKRMDRLAQLGFKVLRFTNNEVKENLDAVTNQIITEMPEAPLGGGEAFGNKSNPYPAQKSPLTPKGGTDSPQSQKAENTEALGGNAGKAPYGGLGAQDITKSSAFPADFIAEGVDQTRGWFYTLHTIAGLVFDSVAYKNVVSNGLVLDKNGQKMSKRLGNAVDPFETIEKYGVDAVRWYMMSNAQPWDNLKFDLEGVAEVQRKFFGTLYNTYSFFALYANIDQFEWNTQKQTSVADRPELDRWILSRLQELKQITASSYNDYEPTRATRAIQNFVDEELSNWYVRLGRRRFWKGEMNTDKQMAYETLYECLYSLCQLISPVAPFFADWLYQNLTKHLPEDQKEESVHLTYLSENKTALINERLNSRMALARKLSSMVFSLRKKESIKVRQPLQKMLVPALRDAEAELLESVKNIILAEVNVKEMQILRDVSGVLVKRIKPDFKKLGPKYGKLMKQIAGAVAQFSQADIKKLEQEGQYSLAIGQETVLLSLEDVNITTDDIPGWLVYTEEDQTVALDITLNQELKNEGRARELINRVQNLRKDKGLEVTDRINLTLQNHPLLTEAVAANKEYIQEEVLANEIIWADKLNNGTEIEFDEISSRLEISKQK